MYTKAGSERDHQSTTSIATPNSPSQCTWSANGRIRLRLSDMTLRYVTSSINLQRRVTMRRLVLSLAALFWITPAIAADSIEDRWNLAELYPSIQSWNADAAKLEAQIAEFGGCKG